MADASLLADIIISKYRYHLPFYWVIEAYKELRVTISHSTINDWFKAVVGKLKPLYDLLRTQVLSCDYVQVDESTLPVIDNEKHRDDDAAQRAAVVYSLLATCKAHGVDERTWLEDVLRRMPEYELGKKDFSELLPGKWSPAAR